MLSRTQAVGSPCRISLKKTESTWQLLEVLGHWESCYPMFTECYLPQRWAKGLVCRKVCYLINFTFQTYGMVTYTQTTQSATLRHVPYRIKPPPASPNRHVRYVLFWDITQHRAVIPYRRFKITYWPLLHRSRNPKGEKRTKLKLTDDFFFWGGGGFLHLIF